MIENDASSPLGVRLVGVKKAFGGTAAVRGLDLTVEPGEFLTLLGPSGCGKTTTLRIVAGLLPQDDGEIWFGDRRVDMLTPNRRNVGLVFQNYALFPHMTVEENVAYGLRMRHWSRKRRAERVDEVLSVVRLSGYGARKPAQLSGGQQQRVAVARALAFNPDLMLLDEPLSNLDAKLREQVRLDLRAIQKETGQTTVFVTHDQVEALVMSDRVVVMNGGEVEQVGTPQELYGQPRTEFVAGFVGANNLLPGTFTGQNGTASARLDGRNEVALSGGTRADDVVAVGCDVWVCVRPEQIEVERTTPSGAPAGALLGTVTDIVYQGASVTVGVRVDGLGLVRAECGEDEARGLAPGDQVEVRVRSFHLVKRDPAKQQ